MPNNADIYENLNWVTSHLSSRVWTIATAVIATCLTLIIEGAGQSNVPFIEVKSLLAPLMFALFSLLFDFIQYLCAYKLDLNMLKSVESKKDEVFQYSKDDWYFKARQLSFCIKCTSCIISVILIIFVIAGKILTLL